MKLSHNSAQASFIGRRLWQEGAALLLLIVFSGAAQAQLTYVQVSTVGVAVSGYTGGGAVTIPSTVYTSFYGPAANYSVVGIANGAFTGNTSITSVTIPDSVTTIDDSTNGTDGAFQGCTNLTSVTTGNGLSYIGSEAFTSCSNLTSLTLGSSVATIGFNAFSYCTSLVSVTIPSSVTSLSAFAFQKCSSLSSAVFQGNAPTMGGGVFILAASNFAVTYNYGATGFTTPTWSPDGSDNYPSVVLGAPIGTISLSGNLVFGNVTVNTNPTSILTINDTGTAPINVSSITYPSGFSGSFSGQVAAGGSQNVTVTFSPTSATSYGGTITVNSDAGSGTNTIAASGTGTMLSQSISAFTTIAPVTYGVAPFTITPPTATSGLPVTVTVQSGPATISGNTVTLTGTGTVVLAANQVGNSIYSAAPQVTTSFTVSAATGADFLGGVASNATLRHSPWFGYYTFSSFPLIYEYSLGYEYAYDAGGGGVYLYDYHSGHFWYTQASYYPFVYDFSLNAFLYYYTVNGVGGKRHFYEFGSTPGIISE